MSDFLRPIARTASELISPLTLYFSSREEFELFLARYGFDAEFAAGDMTAINAALAVEPLVVTLIERLDELINGSPSDKLHAALDVLRAAKNTIDRLSALDTTGGLAALPAPLDDAAFWGELAELLVSDLVVTHLERRHPLVFALLHLGGVIRFEATTPAGASRIPFIKTVLDWDGLGDIFTRPAERLNELYKWDQPGAPFDHATLFRAIERSLLSFGCSVAVTPPRERFAGVDIASARIVPDAINEIEGLLIDGISPNDEARWRVGFVMLPIPDPPGSTSPPRGLLVSPLLEGDLSVTINFTQDIGLRLSAGIASDSLVTARIYPDRALPLETNLGGATIDASVELFGEPSTPFVLIGDPKGSRLELDGFRLVLGFSGQLNDPDIYFTFGTGGPSSKLRLKVLLGDGGDSFVQSLVGGEGFQVEVGGNLLVSSKHGVSFEGSAALDFVKFIHLALGPISIEALYIQAVLTEDGLATNLGVGLKGAFGPLVAIVENIGLRLTFVPVDGGGVFGNLDLQFGFKPPNGIGLSLDTGVIIGGGYLYFDFEKEEYAGALEFAFSDVVRLTAIGLLTTRMPDGSKGFSLLIIITAEFGTGIQLGYGFTLIGVGGLLGLNRTMILTALAEGVRTGAVNGIMFPRDVVANAPRIISDLKAIFPPMANRFLIGPMAKLGWGTPTLVSLSLGIIIEIPGNVAIVGVLALILPTPDEPILILQVNFVGAIEFDKKRVYFFAGLFGSRLLFMTLEGEMGVLAAFGDDANFVLSVGGFHPQFSPPPLPFPSPMRLSINILNEESARIRAQTYFAITPNTVQLGVSAELYFGYGDFSVEGSMAFDALFRFSPFYFIIQVSVSVSLKVFGAGVFAIRLKLSLEGPTPWRARGTATISILFFEFSASFDETWGETRDTSLPPIAVVALLAAEFGKAESWVAELPPSAALRVTLRTPDTTPATLVMHPFGTLRVAQKAVPLTLTIDKVGNQAPSDANRFTLNVTGTGMTSGASAMESFALGQFKKLSDAEKLSRPAYEPQPGGLLMTAEGRSIAASRAVRRSVRYEDVIIDTNFRRLALRFAPIITGLFSLFVKGTSAARTSVSMSAKKHLQPFETVVTTQATSYVVAFQANNRADGAAAVFPSEAQAVEALRARVVTDPALADELHVIPAFEVQM